MKTTSNKTKIFAHILTLLITTNAFSAADKDPLAPPLNKIVVGDATIYTSTLKLKSGEIIHFGCEPITDEKRQQQWNTYANWADYLSNANRGLLHGAATIFSIGEVRRIEKMVPNEVLHLLESVKDYGKLKTTISSVSSGVCGMHTSIGTFVTYISPKEITGFFPFKTPVPIDEVSLENRVAHFISHYDDIIMTVSSFNSNPEHTYEHRGIFRNPMSILRKNYPGLGLLIHAFTGAVRSLDNPKLFYMTVRPDGNEYMRLLLLKQFNADDMYPGEGVLDTTNKEYAEFRKVFTPQAANAFINNAGFDPPDIAIKLSSLKALFTVESQN